MVNVTNKAPRVPASKFKRTKIIATVGPATDSYKSIHGLIDAGANGIRLNFSHGAYDERERQIAWIRKASKDLGKPVAIIADLQGPKIRLGVFDGIINVQKGRSLRFAYNVPYEGSEIPTQYDLSKKVKRGERLLLNDGRIRTVITSVKNGIVSAEAENDGVLVQKKGINLPDTDFAGDTITKKDKEDLAWLSQNDVDYIAQSFVQSDADVHTMRRLIKNLGMKAKIITKFETKAAIENMELIVDATDAIMIARGDLAVEVPKESVPVIQRQLVGMGIAHAKPTIVATQMMYSMVDEAEPTRAEVSDVATAVFIGADCVMLSDETAAGKYPVETVETMKNIILYSQNNPPLKAVYPDVETITPKQSAICSAIINLAESVDAVAIVAETKSGSTALQIAARRPERSVIAVTSDVKVARLLAIVFGTKSYVRKDGPRQATKLTNWLHKNKILSKGDMIVTASGMHPGIVGTTDTIKVRIIE